MKTSRDPRHLARTVAVQKIFEETFSNQEGISRFTDKDIADISEIEGYDIKLFNSLVDGVLENLEKVDEVVKKFANERPLDQISKIDLQILRLAVYEGFIAKTTPPKVAVDEAIELGKEFGGETSGKFINGVLGNLLEIEAKNNGSK